MYKEIYNALQSIFNPIRSIMSSQYMTIPDLKIELSAMLRLYYNFAPFENMKRFKRVIKTPLFNPNRQSIVIVFDYDGVEEDDNEYKLTSSIIRNKFIYEGKVTAITIVPLSIQQDLNNIDYLAEEMHKIVGHILHTDDFGYPLISKSADLTFIPISQLKLHSVDIIYIKWMMDTFMNITLTQKELKEVILSKFKKLGDKFNYQLKHIETYMELLDTTDIEHLLDYSYIAAEREMLIEIYFSGENADKGYI